MQYCDFAAVAKRIVVWKPVKQKDSAYQQSAKNLIKKITNPKKRKHTTGSSLTGIQRIQK